jgi:hypothetical protein
LEEHKESLALAEQTTAAKNIAAMRRRAAVEHAAGMFCALASPRRTGGKNLAMEMSDEGIEVLISSTHDISEECGQAVTNHDCVSIATLQI